jgi:MarR family transcriptional regulator, organic hydroperoxide resistance regulator
MSKAPSKVVLSPGPAIDLTDRLAHLVKDAGKSLSRALQARLARRAIAYGHWTFLRILWKHDGISQTELSRLAGVMAPSTFAAVQAMEDLGYVVRKQKPDNRKTIYIHLTSLGRSLEAELVPLAVGVNDVATQGLSARQVDAFRETLITIIENLEQHSAVGSEAETPSTFRNKRKGAIAKGRAVVAPGNS